MDNDVLNSFVNSNVYNNAIKTIIEKTGIKINPVYEEIIRQRETDNLNRINISIEDCKNILENNYDEIIHFCIEKIKKYEIIEEEDNGGEFPKGEGFGEDEKPKLIERLGYSKGFIMMYICEYYLIKERPDDLLKNIKDRKIPGAKKYEKELKVIYNKIKDKK